MPLGRGGLDSLRMWQNTRDKCRSAEPGGLTPTAAEAAGEESRKPGSKLRIQHKV